MPTIQTFEQQRKQVLGKNYSALSPVTASKSSFDLKRQSILNEKKPVQAKPNVSQKVTTQKPVQNPVEIKKGFNILNSIKDKFLNSVIDTSLSFANPIVGGVVKNAISEEKKKKIADIAIDMGRDALQASPRSAMALILTATKGNNENKSFIAGKGSANEKVGKIEKLVFGEDPIVPIRQTGEKMIKDFGGNDNLAKKYGLPLGAVMVGIDLVPGIPKRKVAEKIAVESSEVAIKTILKKEIFKTAPDDFLEAFAKRLAPISDVKKIEEEITYLTQVNRASLSGKALNEPSSTILEARRNNLLGKVSTSKQSRAVQANITERLNQIRSSSNTPEEFISNIDNLVSQVVKNASGDREILSGLRTSLNKEINGVVGNTGNYKSDYGMLQTLKDDPQIGGVLKKLESHIEELDFLITRPTYRQDVNPIPVASDVASKYQIPKSGVLLKKEPIIGQKLDISGSETENFGFSSNNIVDNKSLSRQDEVINKVSKQINEPPGTVRRVFDSVKEVKTKLIEYVQNEHERIRLIEKGKGVDKSFSPYRKATLYPGRVQSKIDESNKETENLIKEAKKVANKFGTDLKSIRSEVNNYLRFRHAPERNLALGDGASGITTEEAQQGLAQIEASPRGKEIKALADKAQTLNEKVLDILKDSGVITKDLYETLRTKYKNHVPLQRIINESEDIGSVLSGKGLDVRSTGIKSAKGSNLEVEDILGNIINNYQQAVLRSEKNIVDNETLQFIKKNQDVFRGLFEIKHPKAIGKDFNGNILLEQTQDPRILQMYEDGKKTWIQINDLNLATALKSVGKERMGALFNAVSTFTRLYSGLATRFNPEFFLPNKIRDLQETAVFLASQKGIGFSGASKTVARDLVQQNTKAVFDYLRGADTEGARLYKEMRDLGGTTGGFGMSNKEVVFKDLAQLEKLANSKVRNIAPNLIKYIDGLNTIFEDSTRLSVYRQALAQGLSKDESAFLAKEASINFNRMGRGGPIINALWMFSNASIQGSTKMVRALKNPKVLASTVASVGTSVAVVNNWNDKVDPDWREKVSKYDRLNGLTLMLPNTNGEGAKYITIPVSWGIKPIKVMADYAYDSLDGKGFDGQDFANTITTAILEAYNPLGGTDLYSALVPTILDIPSELMRNKSWSGSKIRPDFDKTAPADIQYFDSLKKTKSGEVAISIAELLQSKANIAVSPADIKYAFDGYVGGLGRAGSKLANVLGGVATGDVPPLDEFPLVSRFYRQRTEEEISRNVSSNTPVARQADQMLVNEKRKVFKEKEQLKPTYDKVQKLVKEGKTQEAQQIVDSLSDQEYEIYKSLKKSDTTRQSNAQKEKMYPTVLEVQKLIKEGKTDVAQHIIDIMTDDEYKDYVRAKRALGTD